MMEKTSNQNRIGVPLKLLIPCLLLASGAVNAVAYVSDGSDGAFAPTASTTIDLATEGTNGIFNFTTIDIPENVTVRFAASADNPAVVFGATGDVNVAGRIILNGWGQIGGPGAGEGGERGVGDESFAADGTGPAAGAAGLFNPGTRGGAGGGAGNATSGGVATSRTGPNFGAAGGALPAPLEITGGSGGGGGSGGVFFGVDLVGGDGGGGGGGLQISTPGELNLSGELISDGQHGDYGYAIVGAPGGGGSGGNFELNASLINLDAGATISAIGGAGGGLSSETVAWDYFRFSSRANGGLGHLVLDGAVNIAPEVDIFAAPSGTSLPGFSVDNPILPTDVAGDGSWIFDPVNVLPTAFGGFAGPSLWFDPEVAIGFDYSVADASFASVELPFGFGDDEYEIWLINPGTGEFELVQTLAAGLQLDLTTLNPFGTGALGQSVDALRILGIETSELLSPADTAAFPTGLTFLPVAGGNYTQMLTPQLGMLALTTTVAGPAPDPNPGVPGVPESEALLLLLSSFGGLFAARAVGRRRAQRSVLG